MYCLSALLFLLSCSILLSPTTAIPGRRLILKDGISRTTSIPKLTISSTTIVASKPTTKSSSQPKKTRTTRSTKHFTRSTKTKATAKPTSKQPTSTKSPLTTSQSTYESSSSSTSTKTSTSTAWRSLDCKVPAATDTNMNITVRWEDVETRAAWKAAKSNWEKNDKNSGKQFSQSVSDFFSGPQYVFCQNLRDSNGCTDIAQVCKDYDSPAGYFIIQSFMLFESVSCIFIFLVFHM